MTNTTSFCSRWKTFACCLTLALASLALPTTLRAADHPTKDEVVKFVKEGVEFAKKNGKEAFFKEITTGTSFKRGELYFYVYDWNCVCLAHGAKPALVGKDLSEMVDVKGNKVNQSLRDAAKNGQGWVIFYWQNPTTSKVARKLGYVEKFDDTCWVGSGTYDPEAN